MSTSTDAAVLLRLLQHPTRRAIVGLMRHSEKIWSPLELSEALAVTLSTCSYHVREMRDTGALELVGCRPVRGSTQHFYARGLLLIDNEKLIATVMESVA